MLATLDLATNFAPIASGLTATGATASYPDNAATNAHRFYRVNLLP